MESDTRFPLIVAVCVPIWSGADGDDADGDGDGDSDYSTRST